MKIMARYVVNGQIRGEKNLDNCFDIVFGEDDDPDILRVSIRDGLLTITGDTTIEILPRASNQVQIMAASPQPTKSGN